MIIYNIGELVGIVPAGVLRKSGAEMAVTGSIKNAWLSIEDGRIAAFGPPTSSTASTRSVTFSSKSSNFNVQTSIAQLCTGKLTASEADLLEFIC